MKAAVVTAPGVLEIIDIPVPEIRDYECLVKTDVCGFCNSTDLKMIAGKVGGTAEIFPFILGHEGIGKVVEVGNKVKNYQLGDMVADPTLRFEAGSPYAVMCGQFAEYTIVQDLPVMEELGITDKAFRAHCSQRIAPGFSPADAVILLTFKETLSALNNFGFEAGMDVLLYGDGPVGLALTSLMRLRGAKWIGAVGHWDDRLEKIATLGKADVVVNEKKGGLDDALKGRRFDLIIDAVGASAIIKQSFARLKQRGRICVYGVLPDDDPGVNIQSFPNNTSLHVLKWPVGANDVHDEVVDMVKTGKLNPEDYYSHIEPLENIHEAVRKVTSREAFKVVISL
jgi:L-iditol 2-dehydrogenase